MPFLTSIAVLLKACIKNSEKNFEFVWFTIGFLLGYKCSDKNTCNGHGKCKDDSWCICIPGWSSKEDCSGSFVFNESNFAQKISCLIFLDTAGQ